MRGLHRRRLRRTGSLLQKFLYHSVRVLLLFLTVDRRHVLNWLTTSRWIHMHQLTVELLRVLLLGIHTGFHPEHLIDSCESLWVQILSLLCCQHFLALLLTWLATLILLDVILALA